MKQGVVMTPEIYPSGRPYYRVTLDGVIVGNFEPVDSGFLVCGTRKPVETRQLAVAKVLELRANALRRKLARIEQVIEGE